MKVAKSTSITAFSSLRLVFLHIFPMLKAIVEKPLYFNPFGQTEFAHFGHKMIDPFGQTNINHLVQVSLEFFCVDLRPRVLV